MNPLEARFRGRGVALAELEPGICVPLRFSDASKEHFATRRAVGLFDFSFMALIEIAGPGAERALLRLQTRNIARMQAGRLAYSLLLREDGSVLNDATVWRLAPDRYWLFCGRRSDAAWVRNHAANLDVKLAERAADFAVMALQGPRSAALLARLAGAGTVGALRYFRFVEARLAGTNVLLGRLGYSGELGYELVVPAHAAPDAWQCLLDAGQAHGLCECGFEAVDSLRIESGYLRFGCEIDGRTDPFELGLARLVEFDGRGFVGERALSRRRFAEPQRVLCGLELLWRPPAARLGSWLPLARVTSERHSPLLGRRLALGLVEPEAARPGSLVRTGDGRLARVARLPFYDPGRRLPRQVPL